MNPQVDNYLINGCGRCPFGGTPQCKVNDWKEELDLLRSIIQESDLKEDLKWKVPCYTYQGNNVLILSAFKEFCSISFFKGALLKDEKKILVKQGANTHSARILKFTKVKEIGKHESTIKKYIKDAINIEKSGQKVDYKQKSNLKFPDELIKKFKEDPILKGAFYALTPGRQRGYNLFFTAPKQSKTRESRIDKCIPQIMRGKGLNER